MPSTFGILYIVIKYHAATLCGIAYSPAQRGHGLILLLWTLCFAIQIRYVYGSRQAIFKLNLVF